VSAGVWLMASLTEISTAVWVAVVHKRLSIMMRDATACSLYFDYCSINATVLLAGASQAVFVSLQLQDRPLMT